MHKNAIKYRDLWVAPGSELFAAIEAGETKKAQDLYIQGEVTRKLLEQTPSTQELRQALAKR